MQMLVYPDGTVGMGLVHGLLGLRLLIDALVFMRHDGMIFFWGIFMLKEVGASGQISLGKKYAGQLFDMQIAADGAVTLTPVKVVPVAPPNAVQEEPAVYKVNATAQEWATTHAADIAQYNQWASQREPYSQRVRRWRAEAKEAGSATVTAR